MKKNSVDPHGILFADFYQLTMAQLYFKKGIHEKPAQFEYFFRSYPDYGSHKAGYCIFAGMETLLDWMASTVCREEDIEVLRTLKTSSGQRFFGDDFLAWLLKSGNFNSISIDAAAEGRVVHANVPLAVVQGPLAMAQILETSLLNHLNYETLIATKTSRIADTAGKQPVIEFGMRRGHGDAVTQATRAALIGGAAVSSNTGASLSLGYAPKGTHAHSLVQAFIAMGQGELGAFRAYAELYPDDCILLVDTIHTLQSGIPHAIEVFKELKQKGHKPLGIRLDSGDLAYLSIQAHKRLTEAGFPEVKIVLSNKLDEMVISQIIHQIHETASAEGIVAEDLIGRLIFGVGTSLVTSKGCGALDGVYKLTAVEEGGSWVSSIKMSETESKILNPGPKSVWRIYDKRDKAIADFAALENEDPRGAENLLLHHPVEPQTYRVLKKEETKQIEPLLEKTLSRGKRISDPAGIETIQKRRMADLEKLDSGVKRLVNPHIYHFSISQALWNLKLSAISKIR